VSCSIRRRLVIDKPQGLTSHDVVAVARRALGERRIGHTGTLDPLATGVLPLACGRATGSCVFLTASDKDYDATIRFGLTTDSYDVTGMERAVRSAARAGRRRPRACRSDRQLPADAAGVLRQESRGATCV
jgi:tRNA pseudouridine55 synthase